MPREAASQIEIGEIRGEFALVALTEVDSAVLGLGERGHLRRSAAKQLVAQRDDRAWEMRGDAGR